MGWSFGKSAFGAVAGMMMFAGLASPAAAAVVTSITVSPDSPSVVSGGNVTFTVFADLDGATGFAGTFDYDPSLLSFLGGDPAAPDFDTGFTDGSTNPGFFGYTSTSLGPVTGTNVPILFLTFTTLNAGNAVLNISAEFEDDNSTTPPDNITGSGTVAITRAVAPIPEPATWAMLILGFGLIGGVLRSERGRRVAFA